MKVVLTKVNDDFVVREYNEQGSIVSEKKAEVWKDGKSLKLPENSVNAQWYMIAKYYKQCELTNSDEIEILPRVKRVLGQRVVGDIKTKKSWRNYATEEELKIVDDIMKKAIERMDAELNDPKYKLKMEIERKKKQLEELLKQLNEEQ